MVLLTHTHFWIIWVWDQWYEEKKHTFQQTNRNQKHTDQTNVYFCLWMLYICFSANSWPEILSALRNVFTLFSWPFCDIKSELVQGKKLKKTENTCLTKFFCPICEAIPTCGIAEELLSKLRSWEVYFDWMPWFPHPKWRRVVGSSETEVCYDFTLYV